MTIHWPKVPREMSPSSSTPASFFTACSRPLQGSSRISSRASKVALPMVLLSPYSYVTVHLSDTQTPDSLGLFDLPPDATPPQNSKPETGLPFKSSPSLAQTLRSHEHSRCRRDRHRSRRHRQHLRHHDAIVDRDTEGEAGSQSCGYQ